MSLWIKHFTTDGFWRPGDPIRQTRNAAEFDGTLDILLRIENCSARIKLTVLHRLAPMLPIGALNDWQIAFLDGTRDSLERLTPRQEAAVHRLHAHLMRWATT